MPVRATAQALLEVVAEAAHELVLMTCSATPHEGIRAALTSAVSRGVIEAGLLIRGGTTPQRAAEHIAELKATRVLEQLRQGGV